MKADPAFGGLRGATLSRPPATHESRAAMSIDVKVFIVRLAVSLLTGIIFDLFRRFFPEENPVGRHIKVGYWGRAGESSIEPISTPAKYLPVAE